MTGIPTTTSVVNRRLIPPRFSFPRLAIGASLKAISGLIGDAFKMAYVEPYTSLPRPPRSDPDDDLKGRDPTW